MVFANSRVASGWSVPVLSVGLLVGLWQVSVECSGSDLRAVGRCCEEIRQSRAEAEGVRGLQAGLLFLVFRCDRNWSQAVLLLSAAACNGEFRMDWFFDQAYRNQLRAQDDELSLLRQENERKKSLVAMYESVLKKNLDQLPPSSDDKNILTLLDTAQNASRRSDAGVVAELHKVRVADLPGVLQAPVVHAPSINCAMTPAFAGHGGATGEFEKVDCGHGG
eukprot:INCI7658.10.p1 GENE.INCI7658.10~~INCI7658.10.p1  ORF type:complete len:221 (+),score=40.60 INCI7658.10:414-1076(+)